MASAPTSSTCSRSSVTHACSGRRARERAPGRSTRTRPARTPPGSSTSAAARWTASTGCSRGKVSVARASRSRIVPPDGAGSAASRASACTPIATPPPAAGARSRSSRGSRSCASSPCHSSPRRQISGKRSTTSSDHGRRRVRSAGGSGRTPCAVKVSPALRPVSRSIRSSWRPGVSTTSRSESNSSLRPERVSCPGASSAAPVMRISTGSTSPASRDVRSRRRYSAPMRSTGSAKAGWWSRAFSTRIRPVGSNVVAPTVRRSPDAAMRSSRRRRMKPGSASCREVATQAWAAISRASASQTLQIVNEPAPEKSARTACTHSLSQAGIGSSRQGFRSGGGPGSRGP